MSSSAINHPDGRAAERQKLRLEQLLVVSRRLSEAIAADIAALEQGAFSELSTTDPEIERLCAFYGREVKALKAEGGVNGAPAALIAALKESGAQLKGFLKRHGLLVSCMREAAEGLVQAVAEGVEKSRAGATPYTAAPAPKRSSGSAGAIVYNKVV
jgi:hypothetical protein